MTTTKSDFLRTLTERGYIHQTSDLSAIDGLAAEGKIVAYVGYDCTAPSLHIGHLLSIMMLTWLQKTGAGKPVALMGGGTTRVGDPSGRDETRRILTLEKIEENKQGIKAVFSKFLTFGDGAKEASMVDNADWLGPLNYIEFLRDVGRHFSVNRMLSMDSAKMRLDREQELSFIEFNYMLLQAYDYVELSRRIGCNLQMGGSDQWGNIVTGIDLGRRMGTPQLHALTCPLLTTASGAKMGKTAAGAVWLNDAGEDGYKLSAYDYWQFWRNTEDADVARFLKLFTFLPMAEVEKLAALQGADIHEAKKVLATEATALIHGRDKAEAAAETARKTFEEGAFAAEGLPIYKVPRVGPITKEQDESEEKTSEADISAEDFELDRGILTVCVEVGFASTNSEARRLMANGGLRVNDTVVTDPKTKLSKQDIREGFIKLSHGRKKHVLLRLT